MRAMCACLTVLHDSVSGNQVAATEIGMKCASVVHAMLPSLLDSLSSPIRDNVNVSYLYLISYI
jgi:hypothetical protein